MPHRLSIEQQPTQPQRSKNLLFWAAAEADMAALSRPILLPSLLPPEMPAHGCCAECWLRWLLGRPKTSWEALQSDLLAFWEPLLLKQLEMNKVFCCLFFSIFHSFFSNFLYNTFILYFLSFFQVNFRLIIFGVVIQYPFFRAQSYTITQIHIFFATSTKSGV